MQAREDMRRGDPPSVRKKKGNRKKGPFFFVLLISHLAGAYFFPCCFSLGFSARNRVKEEIVVVVDAVVEFLLVFFCSFSIFGIAESLQTFRLLFFFLGLILLVTHPAIRIVIHGRRKR